MLTVQDLCVSLATNPPPLGPVRCAGKERRVQTEPGVACVAPGSAGAFSVLVRSLHLFFDKKGGEKKKELALLHFLIPFDAAVRRSRGGGKVEEEGGLTHLVTLFSFVSNIALVLCCRVPCEGRFYLLFF